MGLTGEFCTTDTPNETGQDQSRAPAVGDRRLNSQVTAGLQRF